MFGSANSILYFNFGYTNALAVAANYTKIISLEPDNGNAYYNRGISYANINLKDNACDDLNRAGELGFFEAYEVINKYCKKEQKRK